MSHKHKSHPKAQSAEQNPPGSILSEHDKKPNSQQENSDEKQKPLPEKKPMTTFERISSFMALLGFVVAAVTCGVIYWQVQEMRTDQRAWMGFAEIEDWKLEADKPFTLSVILKNVGKTPAKGVSAGFTLAYCKKGETPNYEKEVGPYMGVPSALFLPNQSQKMSAHMRGLISGSLSAERIEQINSGDYLIFAIGKVTYRDIFEYSHWTKYCYATDRIGPRGLEELKFRACKDSEYNEIDAEQE